MPRFTKLLTYYEMMVTTTSSDTLCRLECNLDIFKFAVILREVQDCFLKSGKGKH